MKRRGFLSSLGGITAAILAGCSSEKDEKPPAGSLRFVNRDDLPHSIGLTVTGAGTEPATSPGDGKAPQVTGDVAVDPPELGLTTSASLASGETQLFENVFTESVWYGVEFTFDGQVPENSRTAYHPVPPGRDSGRILGGVADESGFHTWEISETDNMGEFA